MKRKVKIGELKARLSEHLRHVRKGHTITVMDRDTPVAEIIPVPQEKPGIQFVNRADRSLKLGDLKFPPLDPPIEADVVEILLDMRRDRM